MNYSNLFLLSLIELTFLFSIVYNYIILLKDSFDKSNFLLLLFILKFIFEDIEKLNYRNKL